MTLSAISDDKEIRKEQQFGRDEGEKKLTLQMEQEVFNRFSVTKEKLLW